MTLPIAPDDAPTVPRHQPEPPDEETVVVEEPGFRRLSDQQIATIIDMDKEASVRGARLDMALELQQRRAADLTPEEVAIVRAWIGHVDLRILASDDKALASDRSLSAAIHKVLAANGAKQ